LPKGSKIEKCELIPDPKDMRRILHRQPIDQVIFVVPKSRVDMVQDYLYVCGEEGVDASVAVDFFDVAGAEIHHTDLDGTPLLTIEKTFGREWQLFIKRSIDVIISGLGIVILSPLLLLVTILIKLTSPGPVFFSQERTGLSGRKFKMHKFRSMYKGAEKKLKELYGLNEMEGPVFKIKDDPRITPLGKFLRRTSIDELPQLFNVFLGRLSLVGPRPPLEKEVKEYRHWQRRRLSIRPGITCLWQAYHRDEKDFEKWAKSDLEYVDNWSLLLDFQIFMRTILTVITGKGAY
jgi:exopolysaccharide biosynthesis polyprenyl glycosylphosphotransferase